MALLRASRWLVILVVAGCGKEFDSAPSGGVGGSADAALPSPDVASSGGGGSGGRSDASTPADDVVAEAREAAPQDARIDIVPDARLADTGVGGDVVDAAAPEVVVVGRDVEVVLSADGGADAAGSRDAAVDHFRGCPANLPGPRLIEVPAPSGSTYCIDATEVTNANYAAFLTAKGNDTSGQDTWCSWNTSYVPHDSWPTGRDDFPVISVDWCQASAYCKWAGKSLCGKIGGGPNLLADTSYAPLDAWYNACSQGGTRAYPYGNTYEPTTCNGADNFDDASTAAATAVGSKTACGGGYPSLVDMSGNMAEWEDSCTDSIGPDDTCRLRGGAFINGGSELRCDMIGATYRNFWYHFAGIRCCASAL